MNVEINKALLPNIELKAQQEKKLLLFKDKLYKLEKGIHQGITEKFTNKNKFATKQENEESIQYRTVLTNNKIIYEEIIKYKNCPLFALYVFNTENNTILELLIYLKENNIIQQIRKLTIDKYIEDHENDENQIKFKEDNNTIINNLTLLDFIVDYDINNIKEKVEYITKIEKKELQNKLSLFKKIKLKKIWKNKTNFSKKLFIIKFIAFIACIIITTFISIIPTVMLTGMMNLIGIGISIGLGFIAIPWVTLRNRIVDWSFGRKKKNINDSMVFKELKIENRKLQNNKKIFEKQFLIKPMKVKK